LILPSFVSSLKDHSKDHLVYGGLSLPYKKESKDNKIQNQVRSGKSGKMVIVNEPCWFLYRCLFGVRVDIDLSEY
jgi:hypothetical protein